MGGKSRWVRTDHVVYERHVAARFAASAAARGETSAYARVGRWRCDSVAASAFQ